MCTVMISIILGLRIQSDTKFPRLSAVNAPVATSLPALFPSESAQRSTGHRSARRTDSSCGEPAAQIVPGAADPIAPCALGVLPVKTRNFAGRLAIDRAFLQICTLVVRKLA